MRGLAWQWRGCGIVLLILAGQARAQADNGQGQPATPAAAASDAFGERVGIDQVGLYSPAQTRGFDLSASSAAFRLNGFYYMPAAPLSEALSASSAVKVGIAATALDLPSPTGVIAHQLYEPGSSNALTISVGVRDYESPHIEALGTVTTHDQRLGLLFHGLAEPRQGHDTSRAGSWVNLGTVLRWQPDQSTRLRLFASYADTHAGGDISVQAVGDGVPPPLHARRAYAPDWSRTRSRDTNVGLLAERDWNGWSAGASVIRSSHHAARSDTALLAIDAAGGITSTLFYRPPLDTRATSAEAKIARTVALFGADHRIGLAVRRRHTLTEQAEAFAVPAGHFTVEDGPVSVLKPALPQDLRRGTDRVDQSIWSATYGLEIADRLQARLGAHRVRHDKSVIDFDGARSRRREDSWLYAASFIWQPDRRFRTFASYVTGLEESGVAPEAAVNRNAVLPPVRATQYELGARYAVTPKLDLIIAGFDIRKPLFGLRPDLVYAPVGTVRHRGIEASLTGEILRDTRMVLGANIVQPRLSGPEVTAGRIGRIPPGVSRFNATLSLERQFGDGWSADTYLLYEGRRIRDTISRVEMPGVPFTTAGVRYAWTAAGRPFSLRAQVVNAFGPHGYYATPYGPLVPIPVSAFRLLLNADF